MFCCLHGHLTIASFFHNYLLGDYYDSDVGISSEWECGMRKSGDRGGKMHIHSRSRFFPPHRGEKWFSPPLAKPLNFFPPHGGEKWLAMFSYYYADTTPILAGQRPTLFHLVSLECICNLGWWHSIHSPRYWGGQIGGIGVVDRFSSKNHTSHQQRSNHDASHGIIGHTISHNNNSNTQSNPKFCAESVFEVGWVWFSADKSV